MYIRLLILGATVVTGAASGNGRAIAIQFAEHGADIVCADIREEPRQGGDPTHERIRAETDADAVFVECDVSDYGDVFDADCSTPETGTGFGPNTVTQIADAHGWEIRVTEAKGGARFEITADEAADWWDAFAVCSGRTPRGVVRQGLHTPDSGACDGRS